MKKYYGIRFLGGNHTCTTGTANEITGNFSIACDVQVFRSKTDINEWLQKSDLSKPTGLGGGERIAATKTRCRHYQLGISVENFNEMLEYAEMSRY